MLKRTITLVGLTLTVGALLLTLGCGGASNNPVADNLTITSRGGQAPSSPQLRVGVTIWGYKYVGVRSVDPEGERLKYRIVIEGPVTLVFDQTKGQGEFFSSPWSNQPVSDFASGQWAFVKIPNDKLPSGSYVIKAQAYDGSNWSSNNQISLNF